MNGNPPYPALLDALEALIMSDMFPFVLMLVVQMLLITLELGKKDAVERIGDLVAIFMWSWWIATLVLVLTGGPSVSPDLFMGSLTVAAGHTLVVVVASRRLNPRGSHLTRHQQLAKAVGMRVHQDDVADTPSRKNGNGIVLDVPSPHS